MDPNSRYIELLSDLKDVQILLNVKVEKWSQILKNDEIFVRKIYE